MSSVERERSNNFGKYHTSFFVVCLPTDPLWVFITLASPSTMGEVIHFRMAITSGIWVQMHNLPFWISMLIALCHHAPQFDWSKLLLLVGCFRGYHPKIRRLLYPLQSGFVQNPAVQYHITGAVLRCVHPYICPSISWLRIFFQNSSSNSMDSLKKLRHGSLTANSLRTACKHAAILETICNKQPAIKSG